MLLTVNEIDNLVEVFQLPPRTKGTDYIIDILDLMISDCDYTTIHDIYTVVAKKNDTNNKALERQIRRSKEIALKHIFIFNVSYDAKISNYNFIILLYAYIHIRGASNNHICNYMPTILKYNQLKKSIYYLINSNRINFLEPGSFPEDSIIINTITTNYADIHLIKEV